jgi:hypothetical protein
MLGLLPTVVSGGRLSGDKGMERAVTARACIRRPMPKGRDADGRDANPASQPSIKFAGGFWRLVQAVVRSVRATLLAAFDLSPFHGPFSGQFAAAPTGAAG